MSDKKLAGRKCEFKENLKILRKQYGINQEKFAFSLAVDKNTVKKWETGERFPRYEQLQTIKKKYKVSSDFLLSQTEALTNKNLLLNELGINDEAQKVLSDINILEEENEERFVTIYALNMILKYVDLFKLGKYLIVPDMDDFLNKLDENAIDYTTIIGNDKTTKNELEEKKLFKYKKQFDFLKAEFLGEKFFGDYNFNKDPQIVAKYKVFKYLENVFDNIKNSDDCIQKYGTLAKIMKEEKEKYLKRFEKYKKEKARMNS